MHVHNVLSIIYIGMKLSEYFTKEKIIELYERYERQVTSAGFVFGFVMDNLTLRRIDLLIENIVLITYVAVAGASIVIYNLWEYGRLRGRVADVVAPWLPLVMQIAFGALFSGYVVFYSRSGSLVASWPFLFLLAFLLVGNEFFRKRYQQLVFQISIFYIAIFTFTIFFLPVVFRTLGPVVFIASGLLSLALIAGFLYVFMHAMPARMQQYRRLLAASIGGIYAAINILYFTNVIPPIPLSLKDAGAYHSVTRVADGYSAMGEDAPWYAFLRPYEIVHTTGEESIYFYSAVFAPTRLSTVIVHEWQYFDERAKRWTTRSRISFPIVGGRDGGYRGYTLKTAPEPGRWRVNVETNRGQLLGRQTFRVERVAETPVLVEKILE